MAVPPDFTAGQVLTAAQMNAVGLWLIKTQTIGTGVSSVEVTGAFSADYNNYRIDIAGGASSANGALRLTLGATVTGYYYAFNLNTWANSPSTGGGSNAAYHLLGDMTTTGLSGSCDVFNPFASDETYFRGQAVSMRTDGYFINLGGYLNNTTSYTAFTITPSTGTLTGGTIYVYGYRD